ncbi:MAG: hypothetical protein HY331_18285 [Chloroflexi bacterium]|nr:hypothetical protein [Chloroflexota bacterium]
MSAARAVPGIGEAGRRPAGSGAIRSEREKAPRTGVGRLIYLRAQRDYPPATPGRRGQGMIMPAKNSRECTGSTLQ